MFATLFTLCLVAFGASIVAASVHLCEHWSQEDLGQPSDRPSQTPSDRAADYQRQTERL